MVRIYTDVNQDEWLDHVTPPKLTNHTEASRLFPQSSLDNIDLILVHPVVRLNN